MVSKEMVADGVGWAMFAVGGFSFVIPVYKFWFIFDIRDAQRRYQGTFVDDISLVVVALIVVVGLSVMLLGSILTNECGNGFPKGRE